jgi:hypothetical protein
MSNVLNPITEFTPPLVLNPITIDLTEQIDINTFNKIQNYINSLEIPFWAYCIIKNKYIKVKTNEIIIIEYPSFLLTNTNYSFPDDLSKNQKKIISLIKKIYPKLSDIEIVSYVSLIKEKCPKLIDSILSCKNNQCCNNSIINNLLSLNFNGKNNHCNNECFIQEIKKIIKKYKHKNMTKIIIGSSGVNAINKSNYAITMGNFARNDFAQVKIPQYIKNFYTLNKFLEYLQDNQILRNTPIINQNIDLLPRYENVSEDTQIIVQNIRIYRQNDYRKYLNSNELTGTLNYDPQIVE